MKAPHVIFNLLYAKPYEPGSPPSERTKWRDWVSGDLFNYATRKDAVEKETIDDIKAIKSLCENTELDEEDAKAVLDSGFKSYFDYASQRPGSTGAFDADGDITPERAAEIKQHLKTTKSIVWVGVLSFEEEYGKKFCDDKAAAYAMMQEAFPALFKQSHLKYENIEWYATLHRNTDNRHLHITFWEKQPTFLRKGSTEYQYANVAKIKQEACIDFKFAVAKHFEMESLSSYKIRDSIRADLKQAINTSEMKDILTELLADVKASNSWQFGKQSAATQTKILQFALGVIEKDELLKTQYDDYVKELMATQDKYYKICHENNLPVKQEIKDFVNRNLKDLHNRLGNDVIATLKYFDKEYKKILKGNSRQQAVENVKQLQPDDVALLEKIYSQPTGETFKALFEGNYTTDNTVEGKQYYRTEEAATLSFVFRLINHTQDKEQFQRILNVSGVYMTTFDEQYAGQVDFVDAMKGAGYDKTEARAKPYKDVLYELALNDWHKWAGLADYNNAPDVKNLQKEDLTVIFKIMDSKDGATFGKIMDSSWDNTQHDKSGELKNYHLHCFHLVNLVSKYTQDKEQIERIFKASSLYRPQIWNGQYRNQLPWVAASETGTTYGEALIAHCIERRFTWKAEQGKQGKRSSQRKQGNLILAAAHKSGRAINNIVINAFSMLNTRFDNSFHHFRNAIKEQERRRKQAEGEGKPIYE